MFSEIRCSDYMFYSWEHNEDIVKSIPVCWWTKLIAKLLWIEVPPLAPEWVCGAPYREQWVLRKLDQLRGRSSTFWNWCPKVHISVSSDGITLIGIVHFGWILQWPADKSLSHLTAFPIVFPWVPSLYWELYLHCVLHGLPIISLSFASGCSFV